jgi:tetratricopeptide (TPR) repeat protein
MESPSRMTDEAHAGILRRVQSGRAHRSSPEWRWPVARPVFAGAVALSIVLAGLGAQAGIAWIRKVGLPWAPKPQPAPEAAPHGRPAARHAHLARAEAAAPEPDMPEAPPAAPPEEPQATAAAPVPPPAPATPSASAAERPAPSPARAAAVRSRGHAPPVDPSGLAQETRLLAAALDQLRIRHDNAGALATLAEYDARFPKGLLRDEAALARLDARMALGQSAAALRQLDDTEIGGPRAAELLVLRGELRAGAGRHREAIRDFDRALARQPGERLAERALYGRASCRFRAGDSDGQRSKADLEEYVRRFPDGPHAAEVRLKLGS